MTVPGRAHMQGIATECVTLVARRFRRRLDWSPASLDELDASALTCWPMARLTPSGRSCGGKLTGAYAGKVLVRVYGGQWITHEQASGSFAVSVRGMTAFPFAITAKILHAEPYKSLASFGRVLPTVAARAQADDPGEQPAAAE